VVRDIISLGFDSKLWAHAPSYLAYSNSSVTTETRETTPPKDDAPAAPVVTVAKETCIDDVAPPALPPKVKNVNENVTERKKSAEDAEEEADRYKLGPRKQVSVLQIYSLGVTANRGLGAILI